MLPVVSNALAQDFDVTEQETNTFRLDIKTKKIAGFVDGQDAVRQAIYMILNTERFVHTIFSWNYGIELREIVGKPNTTINAYIGRAITEALTQDTRIISVGNFTFVPNGNAVAVTFSVETSEGIIETGWEFNGSI